jgi:hypothetical protein
VGRLEVWVLDIDRPRETKLVARQAVDRSHLLHWLDDPPDALAAFELGGLVYMVDPRQQERLVAVQYYGAMALDGEML